MRKTADFLGFLPNKPSSRESSRVPFWQAETSQELALGGGPLQFDADRAKLFFVTHGCEVIIHGMVENVFGGHQGELVIFAEMDHLIQKVTSMATTHGTIT